MTNISSFQGFYKTVHVHNNHTTFFRVVVLYKWKFNPKGMITLLVRWLVLPSLSAALLWQAERGDRGAWEGLLFKRQALYRFQ
ncbi:MAG: hypothetical protein B6D64_03035 [Bacteroidetes bacterium 4484_276]|nr:MAG: hypothetical protein B6D64_03035 [Bacteroidetes bacterium 4484_276]